MKTYRIAVLPGDGTGPEVVVENAGHAVANHVDGTGHRIGCDR